MLARHSSDSREVPRTLRLANAVLGLLVCYSTLAHAFKNRAQKQLYVAQKAAHSGCRHQCWPCGDALPTHADVGSPP